MYELMKQLQILIMHVKSPCAFWFILCKFATQWR